MAPKTRLEDFFNFTRELDQLRSALRRGGRLIVITGLRRMGKTSLLLTGLGQEPAANLMIDGRTFAAAPAISRAEFIQAFEQALNSCLESQRSWWERVLNVVKRVRGVEVEPGAPPTMHLTWGERPSEAVDLVGLLKRLGELSREDRLRLVLALDEAQEFRRLAGLDLAKLLAYLYDHVRSVQLMVTGSQEGFLHDFLGVENPRSPLYGRHYTEVRLHHLAPEEALAYLEQGFAQIGLKPSREMLRKVVENFNGIIGWLTHLGATAREKGELNEAIVNEALARGAKLAAEELNNFLAYRAAARIRYLAILRRLASQGPGRWAELKRSVEAEQGRKLSDSVFAELLGNLTRAGFVHVRNELYEVADPVLSHAIRGSCALTAHS